MRFFEWLPEPTRIPPTPAKPTPAATVPPVKTAAAPHIEPHAAIIGSSPQTVGNAPGTPSARAASPPAAADSRIVPVSRGQLLQFLDDDDQVWAFPRPHLVRFNQRKSETNDVILLQFAAHHVLIECHPATAAQPSGSTTLLTKILSENPHELFFADQHCIRTLKINPEEGYELP